MLSAAEKSLSAWKGTPPKDLVDAFLLLAPNENEALLKMMSDSRHACHDALVAEMAGSSSPAIIGRLVADLVTAYPVEVLKRRRKFIEAWSANRITTDPDVGVNVVPNDPG